MLLVSLGSLLLRPPHVHTPAAASLVRRRAGPLLACGVPGARSLSGTRKEADRLLSRAFKKTAKANERATACERKEEALLAAAEPDLKELEALPNCAELRAAAAEQAARLERLRALVDGLAALKGAGGAREAELMAEADALGVADAPPARPEKVPKKPKGPRRQAPRVPYRTFVVSEGAEVRVGRSSKDNDRLSIDPAFRDSDDWWLHAGGVPGSHVVVRTRSLEQASGGGADTLPAEVAMDAAVLAAYYSKASEGGVVPVSLVRARQVRKPQGAKPGLVQLSGDVTTIKVDWRRERPRLARLEKDEVPLPVDE